ncbi:hypothetical protein EIP86_001957 [Pleurotus ostreatoroseus]|nr:hypothetical protein EIP86_001957 [Pleurotus ostreatoroseus]
MKQLTIVNHSREIVLCRIGQSSTTGGSVSEDHRRELDVILPSVAMTVEMKNFGVSLTLTPQTVTEKSASLDEKWMITPNGLDIRMPMSLGALCKVVSVPEDCPWRIFRTKVKYVRCEALMIRRSANIYPVAAKLILWISSMAFYGWPISQCQALTTPLAVQLASGIRVLDIRLAVKDGRLIAYHGVYPQRASFQEILATIRDFLAAPDSCKEAIVMSIKQEDFATVKGDVFSKLVREEIFNGPGGQEMWFLDNRIPLLGQVRGKVVMFSRFGGDGDGWEGGLEGIGIHPTKWPDSEKLGFSWDCKNTLVRTHDWYSIPSFLSIPEKTELSTAILLPPVHDPPMPSLAITYFSASSFPLAPPPTIARGFGWPRIGLGVEGVNARVGRWLVDQLSGSDAQGSKKQGRRPRRIRGWALMDFYEDPEKAVVPLLVECNFRGRVRGEEGW